MEIHINPDLINGESCTHTKQESSAWWRGQLTETVWLKEITLYNRDVEQERLTKFVINTAFGRCQTYDSSNFLQKTFPCQGVTNFVEIKRTAETEYLTICEVEAIAFRLPAVKGVTWTSTTDSVTLSWSESPAPDVTYEVKCSTASVAKTTSTTHTCSSLAPTNEYQITITVTKVLSETDVINSTTETINTKTSLG